MQQHITAFEDIKDALELLFWDGSISQQGFLRASQWCSDPGFLRLVF